MSSNFMPWFCRKYSCIHTLRVIKQRQFFFADFLNHTQGFKYFKRYSSGFTFCNANQRLFSFKTTTKWALPRTHHYRYLWSTPGVKHTEILNLAGSLKLSGTCQFPKGFLKTWVFSKNYWGNFSRNFSNYRNRSQQRNRTTAIYTVALVIVVLGTSYAAVPLYRIFCQVGTWLL